MADRAAELGRFLRSRRDKIRPSDVGLPRGGGRRRVPGLRREEVAVLANVGTTWYAWLEQGRDVQPSQEVLAAIADALLLNEDERTTLFVLGGHPGGPPTEPVGRLDSRVFDLVEDLMPLPVAVHDHLYQIKAYNQAYRFLINDLDVIPTADQNIALLSFVDHDWTSQVHDIDRIQCFMVGKLRAAFFETMTDPGWDAVLPKLRAASPRFEQWWERGDVYREFREAKLIMSRHVGELKLRPLSLVVQENAHMRITVEQPADALTSQRLQALAEGIRNGVIDGPAKLRAIHARAEGH